jgi:hypothetical protein
MGDKDEALEDVTAHLNTEGVAESSPNKKAKAWDE